MVIIIKLRDQRRKELKSLCNVKNSGLRDQKREGVKEPYVQLTLLFLSFPLRKKNVAQREREKENYEVTHRTL
jgi:hypothetical protein